MYALKKTVKTIAPFIVIDFTQESAILSTKWKTSRQHKLTGKSSHNLQHHVSKDFSNGLKECYLAILLSKGKEK